MRLGRGHHELGLRRINPSDQIAQLWLTRLNRKVGTGIIFAVLGHIQPQLRGPVLVVRPVAGEALIRQNRSDIAVV